jgi:hypothetical protein
MLHKLTVPSRIDGEHRPVGHVFDVPEGAQLPGTHVQGEAGQLIFRAYAEPLKPHEVEEYEAEQAVAKDQAALAKAEAEEAALKAQDEPAPPAPPKGERVRLTAPALVHGALRDTGYEFFLPEGEKGPMRAVRKGHERIDMENDTKRIDAEVVDEPLYEVVKD